MTSLPRSCPEAVDHVVERSALVRAQAVGFAPEGQVFRLAANEVRPVERAARQIAEAQHGTRRLERRDGLDGVRTPPVAGIDDDAGREGVAGRGGDERVEVGLRYLGAGGVALALDGADADAALLGNEIDAGVRAAEAGPRTRLFGPQPDVGESLPVERVLDEVPFHQPFEETPLLGFRPDDGPDVVQRSLKPVAQALRSPMCRQARARSAVPPAGHPWSVWSRPSPPQAARRSSYIAVFPVRSGVRAARSRFSGGQRRKIDIG